MTGSVTSYLCTVLLAEHVRIGVAAVVRHWRRLTGSVFHPYRPELYYMRGPGPKWHLKHARDAAGGKHRGSLPFRYLSGEGVESAGRIKS